MVLVSRYAFCRARESACNHKHTYYVQQEHFSHKLGHKCKLKFISTLSSIWKQAMQSTNHHGVFQAHYTIITLLLVTKKQKCLFRDSNNCKINAYPSSSPKTGGKNHPTKESKQYKLHLPFTKIAIRCQIPN